MSEIAYVALGANLGEPLKALQDAIEALDQTEKVSVMRCSRFYKTAPIDSSGPDYVNAVVQVKTDLTPEGLLERLQIIENEFGRIRPLGVHNAPRTLDLDLLLYAEQTRHTPRLTLPHPRMHLRAFVLQPLNDIAPMLQVGDYGTVQSLLPSVADQGIEVLNVPSEQ